MGDFEIKCSFGKIGESDIARWFRRSGYSALPVYEKQIDEGKGPQLYTSHGALIAPDLLVFKCDKDRVFWIEAKHKSAFSWHRLTGTWNTGIDQRHYDDYLKVAKLSPWPVWLLFLHEAGRARNTPKGKVSPTGLYGGELLWLDENIHHRHGNWGHGGMVYWTDKTLKQIATLDEIRAVCDAPHIIGLDDWIPPARAAVPFGESREPGDNGGSREPSTAIPALSEVRQLAFW